ncbi:MAG: mechanosensitive ion channel [Crocinitomicaceae bacterium]|jgi:small-conductance mechanosensitive channel|nr:mechanosensitive ion channel [Crocinitomicaceae bacterium]
MDPIFLKAIQTIIAIIVIFIIRALVVHSLKRAARRFTFQERRLAMMLKLISLFMVIALFITISIIWGVSQHQFFLYISSIFTVVGVALFAQWSLLSNVTASVILFLNHPVKIGDTIQILDKEFPIAGKIKDIGSFFIVIETVDLEEITIPNNLLFQKSIRLNCPLKKSNESDFED